MMNDHDRDLIAALAEGHLSGTAAEEALARITADPEMAVAYAEQTAALEFLATQDAPTMTAAESGTLRANLIDQLGLLPMSAPTTSHPKRTSPWLQPMFGAMTAAAVVAAIVILPGTLNQNSAETATIEVVAAPDAAEATTTVTVAASEAPTADGMADRGTSEAAESTAELEESTAGTLGDSVDLADLVAQAQGATTDDEVASKLAPFMLVRDADIGAQLVAACLEELEPLLPPEIQSYLSLTVQDGVDATIAHVGFDMGSGLEAGVSIDLTTCQIVDQTP